METIHVVNLSSDQVPHGSRIVVRVDNADDDDDHPRGLIRGADGIPVARVITRAVYAGQPATHGRSTSSMKPGIGDACTRASCPDRLLDDPTGRVEMSPTIEIETGTPLVVPTFAGDARGWRVYRVSGKGYGAQVEYAAWIDQDDPVRAALALDALSEETRCAVTPRHGPPKRKRRKRRKKR